MSRILNAIHELTLTVVAMIVAFGLWWIMANGAVAIGEWVRSL